MEASAPVHQEQSIAEQERLQQNTAEQIMHVPVPQIQEQSAEGVDQVLANSKQSQTSTWAPLQLAEAIMFTLSLCEQTKPLLDQAGH